MKLTEFYNTDYVNYSSYDNLRKIASLVDGQKNSSRKVLYTVLDKKIGTKIKVSQLGSKCAEFAEYLHAELDNVIVNMAKDYAGTNNVPLLQKKGNFGTRFTPDASASRYIYTYGTDECFALFNANDTPILKHQSFEGNQIEPMFYTPVLPVLLLNGSEGVSSGFAQKILPRNPKTIIAYIKAKLEGNETPGLEPYYRGFKGVIVQGENVKQWIITGIVERTAPNTVMVREIPVNYNLKSYIKALNALEDDGTIQTYNDASENDDFLFEVKIPAKTLKTYSDDDLLKLLKLQKKVSENYTVLNENNKISVFENASEVIDAYIIVKQHYLALSKQNRMTEINSHIELNNSKIKFIESIISGALKINNIKKTDVIKQLVAIPGIIKREGTFDYLLNMNIASLTAERVIALHKDTKKLTTEYNKLNRTSVNKLWVSEIATFEKTFVK